MVKIGAPPALNSRRWSFWRSLRRLCPCRVRTLSALLCLAPQSNSGRRSFPHRATGWRWRSSKTGTPSWNGARLLGACLSWIWHPVFRHGGGGSLAPFRLPPRLPAHPCRHHPGVGDDPHPAPPQAGLRSTSPCPCPLSPRALRVCLGPHQRGPTALRRPMPRCEPLWPAAAACWGSRQRRAAAAGGGGRQGRRGLGGGCWSTHT